MAKLYLYDGEPRIVYAVDQAVGTGCPNRREDVLLVQYFLKIASEGPQSNLYSLPGRPAMECDGLWGTNSQAYLNKYIAANSSANPNSPLTADGRVDAPVNGKLFGSKSGHLYTILALNASCMKALGPGQMNDLTNAPKFPAALRPSFKIG